MYKAVFIDYTGTIMQEESEYAVLIARTLVENSTINSMKEAFVIWWSLIKKYEKSCYGMEYLTEDEIVELILRILKDDYSLCCNEKVIVDVVHKFWSKSPMFDDVRDFFDSCPLPIYIITNNGSEYVSQFLEDNHLKYSEIICADMVRAYKPHREIYEKALALSGCNADEVLHVGDSIESDVRGALAAGIPVCLLDRKNKIQLEGNENYILCHSLVEVGELIK